MQFKSIAFIFIYFILNPVGLPGSSFYRQAVILQVYGYATVVAGIQVVAAAAVVVCEGQVVSDAAVVVCQGHGGRVVNIGAAVVVTGATVVSPPHGVVHDGRSVDPQLQLQLKTGPPLLHWQL